MEKNQQLFTQNVMDKNIGPKLGLSAEDLKSLEPRLNQIHEELETKLKDIAVLKKEMMAWMKLGYQDEENIKLIEKYASEIKSHYDFLLVIGIGGSSLGAKALLYALNYIGREEKTPKVVFLENSDPETLSAFENELKDLHKKIDYSKVAVNVISKSGTTAETSANFEIVLEHMKQSGLTDVEISRRIIATTDLVKGTLRKISTERGYRTLIVPDGVGGRFSVFSDVGLLPLAAGGVNIRKLLEGVRKGFERSQKKSGDLENHAYRIGSILYLLDEKKGIHLNSLLMYGESFEGIAAWFEQLWAESLGKKGNGPRPLGMIGIKAHHGVYQDEAGGKLNKVTLLVGARDPRVEEKLDGKLFLNNLKGLDMNQLWIKAMDIAQEDLTQKGRPNMKLTISRLDEKSLGELLFTFEMTTHVAGRLYGIDPYDQPAVEEAKIGAREALSAAQKIPAEKRKAKPISEPVLDVAAVSSERIGSEHGIGPEEIKILSKRLEQIAQDIEAKKKNGSLLENSGLIWLKPPQESNFSEIQKLADVVAKENDVLVVVGIGGAVVGGKALINAVNYLGRKTGRPEITFIENGDPESLARLKLKYNRAFKAHRLALNVISQSGNTIETLSNFDRLWAFLSDSGLDKNGIKKKCIITTNLKGGRLLKMAQEKGLQIIEVSEKMAGILGNFGNAAFFPLAVSGGSFKDFLKGWRNGLARSEKPVTDALNHAYRLAEAWYLLDTKKGKDLHGFFMYGDAFKDMVYWLEQLWAESLGKSERVGPRPLPMIGTTAQHSVNQDNIDGRNNKAILFIGAQESRTDYIMPGESVDYLAGNSMSGLLLACMNGTTKALTLRKRPNMTMMLPKINEESLGEFFFTMALACYILSCLYGVSPYEQPEVDVFKKKLNESLNHF